MWFNAMLIRIVIITLNLYLRHGRWARRNKVHWATRHAGQHVWVLLNKCFVFVLCFFVCKFVVAVCNHVADVVANVVNYCSMLLLLFYVTIISLLEKMTHVMLLWRLLLVLHMFVLIIIIIDKKCFNLFSFVKISQWT